MPPRANENIPDLTDDYEDSVIQDLRPQYYTCGISLHITQQNAQKQGGIKNNAVPAANKLKIVAHRFSEDSGVFTATPTLSPRTSHASDVNFTFVDGSDLLVWDETESATHSSRFGRYKLDQSVQSGVSATVHAAYDYYTGEKVALKIIKTSDPGFDFRSAEHECWVHQHVDSHPNVSNLKGMSVQAGGQIAIATEFVGPDLFDTLNARDWRISQQEFLSYAKQLASAVAHMHALGFAHRDIKPENVCLAEDGSGSIKLVDFGTARSIDEPGHIRRQAGTHGFMAPEQLILSSEPLNLMATDVWACGVTFFNILTGGLPFGDAADFDREFRVYSRGLHMRSKRKARAWRKISPAVRIMIEGMLTIDVAERWTMADVVCYLDALIADPNKQPPLPSPPAPVRAQTSPFTLAHNALTGLNKRWWRQAKRTG